MFASLTWPREDFVYFFTTRAAYKMNKICLFKLFELQGFQKLLLLWKEVKRQPTKWAKFFGGIFELQGFQKHPLLWKDAFEYFFTKRAAYKMSEVCFFWLFELQGFQESPILSKEVFEYIFTKRLRKRTKFAFFEIFKLQSIREFVVKTSFKEIFACHWVCG